VQEGVGFLTTALAIFESMGETDMTATEMVFLALWLYAAGDHDRPRHLLKQGLSILRKVGNMYGWCRWLLWQYHLYPEPDHARQADEALAYLLDRELDAFTIFHIILFSEAEWSLGNYEKAERLAQYALVANKVPQGPFVASYANIILGRCSISQGDLEPARQYYLGLYSHWGNGEDLSIGYPNRCLDAMGVYLAATGKLSEAVTVMGAVDALYRVYLYGAVQRSISEHDAALETARQALGEEAFEQHWQAGKAMTLVEAFEFGQRHIKNE
jgi:tetratricopeptide (TPR) repeat protein